MTYHDYGIEVPHGRTGEIDTTCPGCSASRKNKRAKCLSVNLDKGTWLCHHCGWTGGLKKKTERYQSHWQKPEYRTPEAVETKLPNCAIDFFRKRGIPKEILIRNKLGFTETYMPQIEKKTKAITFPYYDGDKLKNIKYRGPNKTFRMEAGAERILYGLNDISETTIIVEGEMDKLAMEVAGFQNCVSVPDGAPSINTQNYSSKFSFLESAKERLEGVKQFILAVDNDPPGMRLEDELSRRLGREKCSRVVWPEGIKDANEALIKIGKDALAELVNKATPYPLHGVFSVLDVSDKIDHLFDHGLEKGVKTGWESLDNNYTVRPGEWTVVTGIPNSGKSQWLDALTVNLAKLHGWNFAVFSPENQPIEDHMARLISIWAGMPFSEGPSQRLDKESLQLGKKWLNEHYSWILPDDDTEWTLDNVLDCAKSLCFRKGIKGFVIDPWNELEHDSEGLSETQYISKSLKHIRQFARKTGIHVWIVVHPQKLYRDKDGVYPVPTLYDCSGSAHWRNKSDNGISIWRDFAKKQSQVVEVHVQKIRFRQIGRIGKVELAYNRVCGTYHELKNAAKEIPPSYGEM